MPSDHERITLRPIRDEKCFKESFHLPRCLPALLCVRPRVGAVLLVIHGDVDADNGEDDGGCDKDVDDDGGDVDADDDDDSSCLSEHHHCITAFKC